MARDYIPSPDGDFHIWQNNFVTYASTHLVDLGLVAGDLTPVTTAQTTWNTKYPAHIAAQPAEQSARDGKDTYRTAVERAVGLLARRLQASPSVDDTERAALGITVPDKEPSPVGRPTTRPLARLDCSQPLRHTLELTDESTRTARANPAGVIGAEIWVKVDGPPPSDPSRLTFLPVDTRRDRCRVARRYHSRECQALAVGAS